MSSSFPRLNMRNTILVSLFGILLPAGVAAQPAGPVVTSNFILHPSMKGVRGNELVSGTWTTNWNSSQLGQPLAQGGHGDVFYETIKPYDVVIPSGANLFAITDGTSASPPALITLAPGSSLTNFGNLNNFLSTYPQFPPSSVYSQHSAPVVMIGSNTNLINYGSMGFLTSSNSSDLEAILVTGGSTQVSINNYGLLVGDAGIRSDAGSNVLVYNHSGALLEAGEGNSALGPATRNYQGGGMTNQKINGSYCEHLGANVTVMNWGYCMGSSKGYYIDQSSSSVSDYGGPIAPAAIDLDGHIIFNGTVGSTWESVTGLPTYCSPNGVGTDLDAGAVQFNSGPEVLNFYNTIYTVKGTNQTVDYLPSMFGWPIANHQTGTNALNNATVNFYFSNLTIAQQNAIQSAISASQGKSPGGFTIDGLSFSWCIIPHINAYFSNTIQGSGINGNPLPGVYFNVGGKPAYYTDSTGSPTYQSNPYLLLNAATVQLGGALAEQPGQTTIQPGWTLVIGSNYTTYQYATASSPQHTVATPIDDNFGTHPAPTDSIFLQSSLATTAGNIDGADGQTRRLDSALVINNPTQPITLPNLTGSGSLMQVGRATTTLAGGKNTITGQIFLRDGTLAIAAGAGFVTPPVLSFGARDSIIFENGIHPALDLTALAPNNRFRVGALTTPGFQSQFIVVGNSDGFSFPMIHLGSATLVVGDGSHASHSVYLGGLDGAGALEVAANASLSLGGVSSYHVTTSNTAAKLSTYAGGTIIDQGATLILQNQGVTGAGPVANAGTIELDSATHSQDVSPSGVTAPADPSLQNHNAVFAAAYTQTSSGTLLLRVHGGDKAGMPGSGAGTSYDHLSIGGVANLAGNLSLVFPPGYLPPAGGTNLSIISAPGGVFGRFDAVTFPQGSHISLVSQTILPTGLSVRIARE